MYRPKFCAECSVKIIRLRWHFWTTRKFCESCAPRFYREQAKRVVCAVAAVFFIGMVAGQAARRMPSPVVIQRTQNSISTLATGHESGAPTAASNSGGGAQKSNSATVATEEIYTCGARTKKGTPCTRRVHGPVRCWQHLGLPAMLPQERLRITAK